VSFYTTTTKIGRTSVSVHVDVEVKRFHKGEIPVTAADMTFVCVDDEGRPTPVVTVDA
jgi:acyl-CoA thioesterase YciA